MNLDYSVYPDVENPSLLLTPQDKADYLTRICNAWDFGILPTPDTLLLFAGWKDIFDAFVVPHSPAYAAFRDYYGWPRIPDTILEAPWERIDRCNGRTPPDPCFHLV